MIPSNEKPANTATFDPEITAHTPQIVKALAGQPLEFAAKVMAMALLEVDLGAKALEQSLKARGHRKAGEGLYECALRTVSELTTAKAFAEAKVSSLNDHLNEAGIALAELELGFLLVGCSGCFEPGRTLAQRARDVVAFVKKIVVRTTVESQTVTMTVVKSEPVLP